MQTFGLCMTDDHIVMLTQGFALRAPTKTYPRTHRMKYALNVEILQCTEMNDSTDMQTAVHQLCKTPSCYMDAPTWFQIAGQVSALVHIHVIINLTLSHYSRF